MVFTAGEGTLARSLARGEHHGSSFGRWGGRLERSCT